VRNRKKTEIKEEVKEDNQIKEKSFLKVKDLLERQLGLKIKAKKNSKLSKSGRSKRDAKRASRKNKWKKRMSAKKAKFDAWFKSLSEKEQAQIKAWKE